MDLHAFWRMKPTKLIILVALSCVLWSRPIAAHERVLVPVWEPTPLAGAFGTEWVTELVAANVSDRRVEVRSSHLACSFSCPREDFEPGDVWNPEPVKTINHPPNFLYVDSRDPETDVEFSLRVYDRSLGFGTWGAQIPVVFESEAWEADRKLMLLDVPVDDAFRVTVRIYSFDNLPAERAFRVVVRKAVGRETLLDQILFTIPPPGAIGDVPGYLELGGFEQSLANLDAPVVIQIEPLEGDQRFWAFASVTHNGTQHVTVISP